MPSLSSSTRKRGLKAEAGASRSPADCAPQCLHVLVSHTSLTGSHTPHATSPTKQNQKHALVPPRELARLPMRRVSARESEERRAKARAQPPRGLYPAYVIPTLQLYCRYCTSPISPCCAPDLLHIQPLVEAQRLVDLVQPSSRHNPLQ